MDRDKIIDRLFKVSEACFMIGQSDCDPIIIPTSICDLFILKKVIVPAKSTS